MVTLKSAGIIVGLITGAAGLIGVASYSAGLFNSNTQQITDLLEQENKYTLLSIQDSEDWTKAWTKYKEDNKEIEKDKWNVDGWKKEDVIEIPAGFKKACTDRKNNKVNGTTDPKYKEFINYCTRSRTIQESLKKEGFEPLSGTGQDAVWTNRFNSYKNSTKQFPDLVVPKEGNQKTFNDLKKECEKALKLRIDNSKYSNTVIAVKEWCRQ